MINISGNTDLDFLDLIQLKLDFISACNINKWYGSPIRTDLISAFLN